jgi:hypothetical protein
MTNRRWKLEFHDSRIAEIHTLATRLEVLLNPAVVFEQSSETSPDSGDSRWQRVRIVLFDGKMLSEFAEVSAEISEGTLEIDDATFTHVVPLPMSKRGKVRLRLTLAGSGNQLEFSGEGVDLVQEGDPRTEDQYWLSNGSSPRTRSAFYRDGAAYALTALVGGGFLYWFSFAWIPFMSP